MCCNDKMPMGLTQINGAPGQPVGFDVDPADFMNPGAGFGPNDVMGAIYARMKTPPDEEMGEPTGMMDEGNEEDPSMMMGASS